MLSVCKITVFCGYNIIIQQKSCSKSSILSFCVSSFDQNSDQRFCVRVMHIRLTCVLRQTLGAGGAMHVLTEARCHCSVCFAFILSLFGVTENGTKRGAFANATCRDWQRNTLSLSTQHAAFEKFPAEFHPPKRAKRAVLRIILLCALGKRLL